MAWVVRRMAAELRSWSIVIVQRLSIYIYIYLYL